MPFVPAANVIELVPNFRNTQTLDVAKNVLNFRKASGAVTAADLEAVELAYLQWFIDLGNNEVSNQIQLIQTDARDLTSVNSFIDTNVMTPPVGGQRANAVLPMHTTLAFKLATGKAGRSFRGRLYFVGLYESAVTGDFVAVGVADAILTALNDLKADMAAQGYEWVVVSRFANGLPRVNAVVTPITTISYVDLRVDTQRRRLAGEGE